MKDVLLLGLAATGISIAAVLAQDGPNLPGDAVAKEWMTEEQNEILKLLVTKNPNRHGLWEYKFNWFGDGHGNRNAQLTYHWLGPKTPNVSFWMSTNGVDGEWFPLLKVNETDLRHIVTVKPGFMGLTNASGISIPLNVDRDITFNITISSNTESFFIKAKRFGF